MPRIFTPGAATSSALVGCGTIQKSLAAFLLHHLPGFAAGSMWPGLRSILFTAS